LLQIVLRMLLWALALVLILIWLAASAAVWVIEAILAWRRKTALPAFHVPRGASDAKFGRTAAAAVAIVAVLALIGGSSGSGTTAPATTNAAATVTDASATPAVDNHSTERSAERKARAKRNAKQRVAKARAARERRRQAQATARHKTVAISNCDPSYKGACLDPTASDYDCEGGSGDGPKYTGTVTVVGDDHFDLDRDGDGTGCD
jgi:hypothetical protein